MQANSSQVLLSAFWIVVWRANKTDYCQEKPSEHRNKKTHHFLQSHKTSGFLCLNFKGWQALPSPNQTRGLSPVAGLPTTMSKGVSGATQTWKSPAVCGVEVKGDSQSLRMAWWGAGRWPGGSRYPMVASIPKKMSFSAVYADLNFRSILRSWEG